MPNAVLAQYSVRSKQSYIYRTNRIREITGASENIKNAFLLLLSCAGEQNVKCEPWPPKNGIQLFSLSRTLEAFHSKKLNAVALFEGGGNMTMLYDSRESALRTNRAFTRACLQKCPGMTPLCVFVEVQLEADAYKADYGRLMAAASAMKNQMTPCQPVNTLPFTQMDRNTCQPIAEVRAEGGALSQLTAEAAAKLDASPDVRAKWLDDLVTERGTESLLAVVYADGNSMGEKVIGALAAKSHYDESVNAMRRFSNEIEQTFVQNGYAAVERELRAIRSEHALSGDAAKDDKRYLLRQIVGGGDEITFICNARFALRLTRAYLQSLPGGYSSCAGIAVFHSHYPFAEAYRIAESCCENAKTKPHGEADAHDREQCWIDWYYIHSGVGGDVDDLRNFQQTGNCIARPWQVSGSKRYPERDIALLDRLNAVLSGDPAAGRGKIARTNIKAVGIAYERSAAEGNEELARICSRNEGLRTALAGLLPQKDLGKALYDLSEMYDLWFSGEQKEGASK